MEFIKYFVLFLIFIFASLIGKMLAKKYLYRLEELKEMKNALNEFKTKIKFTYEPIPEIFEEIASNTSKNISNIFKNAKEKMKNENAENAWQDAITESECNLTSGDKKTLNMLSKMLGKSDVEGQISQIDITQGFLDKQIKEAENEKNKNEKLYRKLGTIVGLGLVIILI